MTISEYVCELCEYRYEGCGGLGVLMSGAGLQTVACADCQALHDVDLGVNLRDRPRGASVEDPVSGLSFACPVDPSHAARPWTDGAPRLTVPNALVGTCPRCECRMLLVQAIAEVD